jgi:hypothetical protein
MAWLPFNSAAEPALRAVAVGRRNHLFAGSDAGGKRAAVFHSLVGTAKLNGLDPKTTQPVRAIANQGFTSSTRNYLPEINVSH